jgi:hypothetical protein
MVFDLFGLKRKMLLAQVAESYDKDRRHDFGNNRVEMQLLDKKFEKHIVEGDTSQHHRKIPDQLYPSSQVTFTENKIPAVIKANWKGDAKSCDHCGNVRTYGKILKSDYFVSLEPVLKNTKQKNVENCICAATSCIPEGLQRHEFSKQWIEKVNNAQQ